jgi:hypothetical protein
MKNVYVIFINFIILCVKKQLYGSTFFKRISLTILKMHASSQEYIVVHKICTEII